VKTTEEQPATVYSGKQLSIMDVAERLFGNCGYEGTSVRDIAQEAGVNVAMISYYFGSKEGLLQALFAARISAGRMVLEHLLSDASMEPMEKIEVFVDGLVDRMIDHHAFYRIMLRADLSKDHESIGLMISELKLKNLELVTRLIREGQEKKVFTRKIDVALLMMTVIGTIYQAATGSQYVKKTMGAEHVSDTEFTTTLRKKLKTHLNHLFKAVLTYEVK